MFTDPASFIALGLRTFMRSPFFNLSALSLTEGECDFRLLERRDGLIVTLGPNTSLFDRPGRSVLSLARNGNHPATEPSSEEAALEARE